jgi:SRSO17 transposase
MKAQKIDEFKQKLESFLADLVLPMGRSERRRYAGVYIRGLLTDGERKSIEPMANRIPDGNVQALQQFVNQSPLSHQKVRESLARKVEGEFVPEAHWIIDEVSFPKKGRHSVGVAHQYCGTLGKTANCQVAVTLDLGTDEASIPLDWALYLPKEWIDDPSRRKKTSIPEEVTFKTKPRLALDLIDEVRSWGLKDRLVLADSLYGDSYEFRHGLRSRGLDYVVQVEGRLTAWTIAPHPSRSPTKGKGEGQRRYLPRKDLPRPQSLKEIAQNLPSTNWKEITWREGTKGPLCSRFARVPIWCANGLVQGKSKEVEAEELLIEWPEGMKEPYRFWLSSLGESAPWRELVRCAKGRFRIEQDYREMKRELGLDHFEGRSWQGWHHHVTLVAMAYTFLMLERIDNKKTSGLTLPTVRKWIQRFLLMYTGICPTCGRDIRNKEEIIIYDDS